jgi:GNAT superfamily N-acetyltransferase
MLDRMLATMRSAFRAWGGRWFDRDGVSAVAMPTVPERSLFNAVVYERGADVAAVYDELESLFAGAWTVWVPDDDEPTARFLESKGHKLDAHPAAMLHDLTGVERDAAVRPATVELLGSVNEAAYPWRDGSVKRATAEIRAGDFNLHSLEDASVVGIHDCDGDAGVFFMATLPEAQGRGLATRLLRHALAEARERGCEISTLQATPWGEPVYERLGYSTFTRMQMWERR